MFGLQSVGTLQLKPKTKPHTTKEGRKSNRLTLSVLLSFLRVALQPGEEWANLVLQIEYGYAGS